MARRCCCLEGCIIFEDDFARATDPDTNLGSDWEEVAGDSSIDGGKLLVPANGIVMATTPHPLHVSSGHVWATMKAPTGGDVFRVLIQYDDRDDSYLYGECEVTDNEGNAMLRVGSDSGILHEIAAGTLGDKVDTILSVCRSKTGIYAQCEVSTIAWECVPEPGHYAWKSGLMNNGGGDVHFDDFMFMEHWFTDTDCPGCECDCDGYCVEKTLTLTFYASGFCSRLDGSSMTLTWDQSFFPDFVWEGEADLPNWMAGSSDDVHYHFRLYCDPDPWHWTLGVGPNDTSGIAGACDVAGKMTGPPATVSCDPFIMEWLGGLCDESGYEDCGWAIKITA